MTKTKNIMAELTIYLERAKAAQDDDARLARIMTDMENRFDIPRLASRLPEWERNMLYATNILETYKYISGLRKFT
jgi:hypothetical protein